LLSHVHSKSFFQGNRAHGDAKATRGARQFWTTRKQQVVGITGILAADYMSQSRETTIKVVAAQIGKRR
jgi:hypothetical protein